MNILDLSRLLITDTPAPTPQLSSKFLFAFGPDLLPTNLGISSVSTDIRSLRPDSYFPDLFELPYPGTSDTMYLDYLDKKIRRLGYDPVQFAAVNPDIRALPSLLEERTPDFSNQIIHKGRT